MVTAKQFREAFGIKSMNRYFYYFGITYGFEVALRFNVVNQTLDFIIVPQLWTFIPKDFERLAKNLKELKERVYLEW